MDMVGHTVKTLARSVISPATGKPLGIDTVGGIVNKDVSYAVSKATPAIWDRLEEALSRQDGIIATALEYYDSIGSPDTVELRYWTTAREYSDRTTDSVLDAILDGTGGYHMANANRRRFAAVIESEGATVQWVGTPTTMD